MKKLIKYMCVLAVAAIATIVIMYNMSSAEGEIEQPAQEPTFVAADSVTTDKNGNVTIPVRFNFDDKVERIVGASITITAPEGVTCTNEKDIYQNFGNEISFNFSGFLDVEGDTAEVEFSIEANSWSYKIKGKEDPTPGGAKNTITTVNIIRPSEQPGQSFQLNSKNIEIEEGTTTQLPGNSLNKNVTWTSDNLTVAVIDGNNVIGLKAGEATLTAKTAENESDTLIVTVNAKTQNPNPEDNNFTLSFSEVSMKVGESRDLPEISPQKDVTWRSSDESVVKREENKFIAMGEGNATLTATAGEGENAVSRELKVIVTAATQSPDPGEDPGNNPSQPVVDNDPPTIEPKTMKMLVGDVNRFGTDKEVTWSSSNNSIAIINKSTGQVTAVGEGKVTITATAKNGKEATAQVEVVRADGREYLKPVISPNSDFTINVGDTYQLNCENGIPVEWSSTDETVAIVDSNGVVKGIGGGDALIYAKSKDSMVSSVKVTVKGAPAKKKSGGTTTNKTGNVATDNGNSSSTVNEEVPSTGEASTGTIIILGAVTLIVAAVLFRKRMK